MTESREQTTRRCDVVMKGGITSGIVYPKALFELSESFRFQSVGGTSAGAIAAGIAAAAECGRRKGDLSGLNQLAKLPSILGGKVGNGKDSLLFSLFQPQRETRALFRTLVAGLGKSGWRGPAAVLAALPRRFPLWALLGLIPGAIVAWLLVENPTSRTGLLVAGALVAFFLLAVGATLFALVGFVRKALRAIPKNLYGLCTGLAVSSEAPALTPWLDGLLDQLAGMDPEAGEPLTFGHLWGGDQPQGPETIRLEMMTTCLSHGRPYRLPWDTKIFYFHEDEFAQFFPPRIVEWLISHSEESGYDQDERWQRLHRLPSAAELPVLVAMRMSLSFPILLSAVPLWSVDRTLRSNEDAQAEGEPPTPERCWFSDGGICSNFPVHFFDSPLPSAPTFDFNLRAFHPDHPRDPRNQENNVYVVHNNKSGVAEQWSRFEKDGQGSVPGFVGAILNTMQNWTDRSLLKMPGYRDRVAHIFLADDEGGLNLNMPQEVIDHVSDRGQCAARKLRERFTRRVANGQELDWDNHRWIRLRTTMFLLEEMLAKILEVYELEGGDDPSYRDLTERGPDDPPNSYRLREPNQRAFAVAALDDVIKLAREWKKNPESFVKGAPKPRPELRARPRI